MTVWASEMAGATRPGHLARPRTAPPSPRWRWVLPAAVAGADAAAAVLAALGAVWLRYRHPVALDVGPATIGAAVAALGLAVAWVAALAAQGAYRRGVVGTGPDEMRRVLRAGLGLLGALAIGHLVVFTDLSGRLVLLSVTLVVAATLAVRFVAHQVVARGRARHRWVRRAVLYGSTAETGALARCLHASVAGVDVVGTCLTDGDGNGHHAGTGHIGANGHGAKGHAGANGHGANGHAGTNGDGTGNGNGRTHLAATGGDPDVVLGVMAATGADVLAVTAGTPPARLRALAWALEGTGADVLVAPAVADVARQRVAAWPAAAGVPLLRVEGCRLSRGRLLVKNVVDRCGAILLLAVLSPLLAAVAVAVRLSGGPVLYRQRRVGRDGDTFTFLKFRTMTPGADGQTAFLAGRNMTDGLLFKVADDPRVTRVGRHLRRLSLDELPQLWNVVRGDMSLVGPRPLPVRPEAFVGEERRRLRVKPGLTGLWQISGRSELTWAETVRLDTLYVDQWSLGLDLTILARTPLAVVRGRGAY